MCQTAPLEEKPIEVIAQPQKIEEKKEEVILPTKELTDEELLEIYAMMYKLVFDDKTAAEYNYDNKAAQETLTKIQKERAKEIRLVPQTKKFDAYIKLLKDTSKTITVILKNAETKALEVLKQEEKEFNFTKSKKTPEQDLELRTNAKNRLIRKLADDLREENKKMSEADYANALNEITFCLGKAEDYLQDLPAFNVLITEKCPEIDEIDKKCTLAADYGYDNLHFSLYKFIAFQEASNETQ
jgi:hypothetical protein